MAKKLPPAREDFLALAQHDPSVLTFRHCTSDDIRRLAPLVPMPLYRARRAFTLKLFNHHRYLTLSLDPAFEPKQHARERAALILLGSNTLVKKKKASIAVPPPMKRTTPTPRPAKPLSKIARYSFD